MPRAFLPHGRRPIHVTRIDIRVQIVEDAGQVGVVGFAIVTVPVHAGLIEGGVRVIDDKGPREVAALHQVVQTHARAQEEGEHRLARA